jgi:hypothetical protein
MLELYILFFDGWIECMNGCATLLKLTLDFDSTKVEFRIYTTLFALRLYPPIRPITPSTHTSTVQKVNYKMVGSQRSVLIHTAHSSPSRPTQTPNW